MKMGNLGRPAFFFCASLCVLSIASVANALTDEALFRDLQFDWARPGAGSMAMGGAGVALVDDATSIGLNPAGLSRVGNLEILGEYRVASGDGLSSAGASIGSADPGGSVLPYVGANSSFLPDRDNGAGFVGIAMPVSMGDRRLTLGFSREMVLDQTRNLEDSTLEFSLDDFPIWINPVGNNGGPAIEQYTVVNGSTGRLDTNLVHYNFAAGLALGSDFSLGATVTLAELDMTASQITVTQDPQGQLERPINPRVDTDSDGLPDDVTVSSAVDDSDSAIAYTLGLGYQPNRRYGGLAPYSFGLTYSQGAHLEVDQTIAEIAPATGLPQGERQLKNVFRVPDRWRVGFAGSPAPNWTIGFDIERIEYSDLLEDLTYGADVLTSGLIDPDVLQQEMSQPVQYEADDATIFHVGAGYDLRRGAWKFGFRGGYFNSPDGSIRMTGFNSSSAELNEAILSSYGGEDNGTEDHFTAGFAVDTPFGLGFQLSADLADIDDRYLLSTVWRPNTN